MDEINKIWNKYEKSHSYMDKKSIVTKTNRNWNMYIGRQWEGLNSGGEQLPMHNFIKPTIKYKISAVAQHNMVARFSDNSNTAELQEVFEKFNELFALSYEKSKMDSNLWHLTKDASISGDSYLYFPSGDTTVEPQCIANTSMLLGDENITSIQDQPYIIIRERLSVRAVRKIAKQNGIDDNEIENIKPDSDTTDQILNKDEVKDKVTSLLYFQKIDGVVNVARATKTCIYEELHPLSGKINGQYVGGQRKYPIVAFIWERKPNDARGISEVECLIPNQLELNKTLARRAITVKLAAFPRLAYDVTAVENPDDLDKVGAPIGIIGNAQSISASISYLNATNISSDAQYLCDDLLNTTRNLAGAGDSALGNIDNLERVAASAIQAVREQSETPLQEQLQSYQQTIEDIALLWFDLWITYKPEQFTVNGQAVSYEVLLKIEPSVKIDVSQNNQWSKLTEQQSIDNLLATQQISFEEYVNLLDETSSLPKARLLELLERRKAMQGTSNQLTEQGLPQGQANVPQEQIQ